MTETLRRRLAEARLALMLLTRLPAGTLSDPVPTLSQALWAYPLVGLVVGPIGWAVLHAALALGLGALPAALLALGAVALATGALHHDGLADFADGIGGGRDRAHRLEIMRDSRVGSYGVLALVFAVLLSAAALGEIAERLTLAAALLIGVASRLMMLVVLMGLPPARADGLGRSASARSWAALAPGAAIAAGLAIVVGLPGLAALVAAVLAALAIAVWARTLLGGQTGDVLGAVQIVSQCAGWVALSAFFGP